MTGSPSSTGTIALVLLAGSSLSLQNLILSAMVARGLGPITALALNSAVGLALLVGVNLALLGPGVLPLVAQAWRWWFIVPGLLGTLAVFAMLTGYTRLGAATPTIALIAGQVLTALLLDLTGLTLRPGALTPAGWAGIALFVVGAALFLYSRNS
jgi:bacterial/archaeal transporter family-2 protein